MHPTPNLVSIESFWDLDLREECMLSSKCASQVDRIKESLLGCCHQDAVVCSVPLKERRADVSDREHRNRRFDLFGSVEGNNEYLLGNLVDQTVMIKGRPR
jgi:hypothetical protein